MARKLPRGARLVLATHNPGKLREIEALLRPFAIDVVSAGALGLPEPPEDAPDFFGNARIKALASATASGLPALSDDSGFCVAALDGAPGVMSARWAGPEKDFSRAMADVQAKMGDATAPRAGDETDPLAGGKTDPRAVGATDPRAGGVTDPRAGGATVPLADGETDTRAWFIAALCLAWPDGHTETFLGRIDGTVVWPPRGAHGFGYDPMFLPAGGSQTFGEMDPDAKHAISHRARAFAQIIAACFG